MSPIGLGAALLLLLHFAMGEPASGSQCAKGKSWSSDLGKCMNCAICQESHKNDFCTTCDVILPQKNELLWPIVGSAVGAFTLLFVITTFLLVRRCKKKEKFTTPIEETGGHSAEESLLD
ncbi:tumor necrosis factor receptor superfamily member 12A [Ambystoma mexicanum]|uniref:tumor necrosis factor receptor superfamily member 12A n=1 Tax=Ambystoma mexicanum TaxID=8296 RepID=UPI0037E8BD9F